MKQKIPRHLRKELKMFNRTLQDRTQWEKRDWPLRARESTDEILKELKMEIVEAFARVTCHTEYTVFNVTFAREWGGIMYSDEFYDYLSANEERDNWHSFDPYVLMAGDDALYTLFGDAFRFIAPAFMLCSLERIIHEGVMLENILRPFVISLSHDNAYENKKDYDYYGEKYSSFTPRQKEVTTRWVAYWREELKLLEDDLPDYVMCPWEWEEYKLAGNEIPSSQAFGSFGILERFMPYENYMICKNTSLFNALLEEAKQRRTNSGLPKND